MRSREQIDVYRLQLRQLLALVEDKTSPQACTLRGAINATSFALGEAPGVHEMLSRVEELSHAEH